MTAEISEKIVNKIAKLFELANNNSSDAEAKSALLMAQQWMVKYGLTASDIDRTTNLPEAVRCEHKWDAGWRKQLAIVLAPNYRCKPFLSGNQIYFIGFPGDAQTCKQCFEGTYSFIYKRANQEYDKAKNNGLPTRGIANSYAMGFCAGIKSILSEQCKALQVTVPTAVENEFSKIFSTPENASRRTAASPASREAWFSLGYSEGREKFQTKQVQSS